MQAYLRDAEISAPLRQCWGIIETVVNDARKFPISDKIPNTISLEIIILLSIWYLSSKEARIKDAIKIFKLKPLGLVKRVLQCGLQLINRLKEDCGMVWPTENEMEATANRIQQRFVIDSVMGVLSKKLFITKKKKRILLQVLINEDHMYKFAEINYNTSVHVAVLATPSLLDSLNNIPNRFLLCADEEYDDCAGYLNTVLLTPLEDDTGGINPDSKNAFNLLYNGIYHIAPYCFAETIDRFPRLLNVHVSLPEAITAACVLHNYWIRVHGQTRLIPLMKNAALLAASTCKTKKKRRR